MDLMVVHLLAMGATIAEASWAVEWCGSTKYENTW